MLMITVTPSLKIKKMAEYRTDIDFAELNTNAVEQDSFLYTVAPHFDRAAYSQ